MLQYLLMNLTSRCGFLHPSGRQGLGLVLGRLSLGRGDPQIPRRTPDPSPQGRGPGVPCRWGRVDRRSETHALA